MTSDDTSTNPRVRAIFEMLATDTSGDGGLDARHARVEPPNYVRHVAALAGSKIADWLIDPKLVLTWLVNHIGAGAGAAGMLVPVREAGALLPQLFISRHIGRIPTRKLVWAAGAALQGVAALAIAVIGAVATGPTAGYGIVAALATLAVARSACSVAVKDVLGKTVGAKRRGSVTGSASTAASAVTLVYAAAMIFDLAPREWLVLAGITGAGLCWLAAGAIFATLAEHPDSASDDNRPRGVRDQLCLVAERPQLRLFIVARSLLVATALAPPYLVLLSAASGSSVVGLGRLVLASAAATLVSSFVWGRLADTSSRRVLMFAGVAAALALAAACASDAVGVAGTWWAIPGSLAALMISYNGVRTARSTYLVDMAPADDRAAYTAASNTIVGVVLIAAGGALSALAAFSVLTALYACIALSLGGAVVASRLHEVTGADA